MLSNSTADMFPLRYPADAGADPDLRQPDRSDGGLTEVHHQPVLRRAGLLYHRGAGQPREGPHQTRRYGGRGGGGGEGSLWSAAQSQSVDNETRMWFADV